MKSILANALKNRGDAGRSCRLYNDCPVEGRCETEEDIFEAMVTIRFSGHSNSSYGSTNNDDTGRNDNRRNTSIDANDPSTNVIAEADDQTDTNDANEVIGPTSYISSNVTHFTNGTHTTTGSYSTNPMAGYDHNDSKSCNDNSYGSPTKAARYIVDNITRPGANQRCISNANTQYQSL